MEYKYQAGDKVRFKEIDKDYKGNTLGITRPTLMGMSGKVFTIRSQRPAVYSSIHDNDTVVYRVYETSLLLLEEWLEPYYEKHQPIIIYHDRNRVVALDKNTGALGEAKCNPKDTFDFYVGAQIAFDRLIDKDEHPVPIDEDRVIHVGDIVEIANMFHLTSFPYYPLHEIDGLNMGLILKFAYGESPKTAFSDTFVVRCFIGNNVLIEEEPYGKTYVVTMNSIRKARSSK